MARLLAVLFASAFFLLDAAHGQPTSYPNKSITIVVPTDPGGLVDLMARTLGKHLGEKWGHTVVVENVRGASYQIGTTRVARSDPDGYTLLLAPEGAMVVNPFLFPKLGYEVSDFAPISGIIAIDTTMVAKKTLPVSNVADVLALAKKRPGELTFGTFGLGSNAHLFILSLEKMAGVSFSAVHYKGAAAPLTDVIAGHIDLTFVNANNARDPVEKGLAKMLATTGPKRLDQFPNVPTIGETVPGYQAQAWFGVWARAGTPSDIIRKLNAEVRELVASAEFQERFVKRNGWRPIPSTPEEFQKFVEAESEKWGALVRSANLRM